jgi:hypothetical protein
MNRIFMVILTLVVVELVQAHGLSVRWQVQQGQLMIKADSEGALAVDARVEVRSAGDELLASGKLDETGSWQWPLTDAGELTVVVDSGLGHRRSLTLTGEQLRPSKTVASPPAIVFRPPDEVDDAHAAPTRGNSDEARLLGLRVVVGLTFVLALAAGWVSFRNMRRLDELERQSRRHESRS